MKKVLISRIENSTLTKNQVIIADYFSRNEEKICFMTLNEVAAELGMNDTAIMRFCRAIGFNGFKELQNVLQQNMLAYIRSLEQGDYEGRLTKRLDASQAEGTETNLAEQCLQRAAINLKSSVEKTDANKYYEVARLLGKCKRKFIVGFRGSTGTATSFAQGLRYIVQDVICVTAGDWEAAEKMAGIGEQDVVVIISYARYGKIDKLIVKKAKEKGAKVCVITDMPNSPITSSADYVLHSDARGLSFFNSQVCALFTTEIILTILAEMLGNEVRDRLNELDEYIEVFL